jgi:hypothetical protein
MCTQILVKLSNIILHSYLFNGSQIVAYGLTDRHGEANTIFFFNFTCESA